MRLSTHNNRLPWVTDIKGLCMILVYVRHCPIFLGEDIGLLGNYIEPVLVNAFFLVSGYLFFRKRINAPFGIREFSNSTGNIFFRTILPSIIFALLFFFPKTVFDGESFSLPDLLLDTIGGCTYWFTSALSVSQILMLLLLLCGILDLKALSLISIAFCITGVWLAKSGVAIIPGQPDFPWMYRQGFIAMVFFVAGGVYMQYEEKIDRILTAPVIVLLCLIYFGSLTFWYESILCTPSLCWFNFQGAVIGIIGCLLLIRFFKFLPNWRPLCFIGDNSIGFYFLCGGVPKIIAAFFASIPWIPGGWVIITLSVVISLSIAWTGVVMIKRFLPFMLDLRILIRRFHTRSAEKLEES